MTRSIYEETTARIIDAMEASDGSVETPWIRSTGRPVNALTENPYHGVNVVLLWLIADVAGYSTGEWATYKQWQQLGGQVRKNQKAARIVIFKMVRKSKADDDTEDGSEDEDVWPMVRYAFVFNRDQVDGVEKVVSETPPVMLDELERFVKNTGATVEVRGGRAAYSSSLDLIVMPERELFTGTTTSDSTTSWYAVLLHELSHWTGHTSRLNRNLVNRFGDEDYAVEELIAELGSAFLCADLGISSVVRKDHVDYLKNWIKVLKNDSRAFFKAASAAEKAAQ
ncbi:MAG TPA: DUF1738 domain-containing protein, partial [Thiotrichales bacterium]|nr:DUF1738 domain-containing protein [Thiotrichales bacterium]